MLHSSLSLHCRLKCSNLIGSLPAGFFLWPQHPRSEVIDDDDIALLRAFELHWHLSQLSWQPFGYRFISGDFPLVLFPLFSWVIISGFFPPALPPRLIFIGEILLKILCSRPPSPPLPSRLGSPGSFAYLRIRRSISKNPNQVQLILTNRLQPSYHRSHGHD